MKQLEGKVAVVVGAGRGIGRDIAVRYALEGAKVVIAARTSSELEVTFDAIDRQGALASTKVTDVSNPTQVEELMKWAVATYGSLDVVINCAAIQGAIGLTWENDVVEWAKTIQINLLGSFYCARYSLPFMMSKRKGKLIFLSGGGAAYPRVNFSAYGSSKAAVVRLGETIAEEVKAFNVQVNVMAPGPVKTKMLEEVVQAGAKAGDKALEEARKFSESGGTPPEKYTGLALFLASEASGLLTGKFIHVNDPWKDMSAQAESLNKDTVYTLRRINPPTQPSPSRGEGKGGGGK